MQYIDIEKNNIKESLELHIDKLVNIIRNKARTSDNLGIRNYLTVDKIKKILGGKPKELECINNEFYNAVVVNFDSNDLEDYNKITNTRIFTNREIYLKGIFEPIHTELNNIFNYKDFIDKKKRKYSAYNLAEMLDIPTCIYCNRMYTKTVLVDEKDKITRPTFDHWFPKSEYPLLALSFYNLIPSCSVCNSGVKSTNTFKLTTHFHPYHETSKLNYRFSYNHKDYDKFTFKIKTSNVFSKKSINAFKLEEIYKAHEDEIEDLRRIKDAYSSKYLESLDSILKGVNLDKKEVYRLAFGVHYEEDKFDRRPLSKMKKDILKELGVI